MTHAAPTNVRRRIVAVSMAMAFILYLDRICLAEIVNSQSFHAAVALSKVQIGRILGIFFFAYAVFQVPAGWISDRFGARRMLTLYIVLWSLATSLTGMVSSFPALLTMRLFCGIGEAGAYPTSAAVIRRWFPLSARARASSLVIVGGRLGGTLAPFLTALMVVSLGHWRPVLWLDGAIGLVIAAFYWHVVRDRPAEHPACNSAERTLVGHLADELPLSAGELGAVLRAFCLSRSLWLISLEMLFGTFGYSFLITWLPTYLKEQRHVDDIAGGRMVSLALACGMVGQLVGGWLADWGVRSFGLKRGRIFSICASGLLAGTAYIGCLFVESAWGVVACCGLVSFAVDLGNPGKWAFFQDIGGRVTAAALGWGNMWGNFGAALTAVAVPWLVTAGATAEAGQRNVFMVCAGALFLSGLISLGLDATKLLVPALAVKTPRP